MASLLLACPPPAVGADTDGWPVRVIRRVFPDMVPVDYTRDAPPLTLPRVPHTPPRVLPVGEDADWPPPGALTLDSAVALAVRRSASLRTQVAEVEGRIGRIHQSASGTQPRVELRYTATRYQQPLGVPFSTSIISGSVRIQATPFTLSQFEDRLQLTQLISDGGRTRMLVMADVAAARTALASLLQAVLAVQHEVRLAYIGVLEARAQVAVAEQTLAAAEEHLRMARTQCDAGVVARADVTYSTTPLTRARLALHNARTLVDVRAARLLSAMGVDPGGHLPSLVGAALDNPQGDLLTLRGTAARERPDLEARRQEKAAALAALDAVRRSRSVNVQGTAGFHQVGYQTREIIPAHSGWEAALQVSYPMLDGGLVSAQIEEAGARARAASEREDDLARNVDEQVVTTWMALQQSCERLALADAEVTQAATAYEVAQGQYQAGVGTNLQVLDAQVDLARSRADAVAARYAVERARADLLLAVGH